MPKILCDYGGIFFFNAPGFTLAKFHYYELTKIYRQKDYKFTQMLNNIREKEDISTTLAALNHNIASRESILNSINNYVILTARKALAADINKQQLEKLDGQIHTYVATIQKSAKGKSLFDDDKILHLKKDAKVMFTNNDSGKRWVNGTVGIVVECNATGIKIRISDVCYRVEKEKKEVLKHKYDRKNNKIRTQREEVFLQYPLKLAYAMTIHKSQGKTFDRVFIDLGYGGAFDHGQVYVALSRCTSLEGVKLGKPLTAKDIIFNKEIIDCREKYFH